jgi:tetratricopeptide (TPR) repeat protein
MAAEPRSTVGFVEPQLPAITHWSESSANSLRASNAESGDGNSLRFANPANSASGGRSAASAPRTDENVAPASYNERSTRGLQLRPHTQPTGMLSNILGETSKPKSAATATKATTRPKPMNPPAQSATAAKSSKSMWPSMFTDPTKFPSLNKTGLFSSASSKATAAAPTTATASRAGSVQHAQPTDRTVQAAYQTAASAQAYRPTGNYGRTNGATPGQALPSQSRQRSAERSALARPTSSAASPSIAAGSQASATTLALARAHKAAATAKTEAEFSEIITTCQRIRTDQATSEETAFGRQLASWAMNRRGQLRAGAGRTSEALADFDIAIRLDAKCWRAIHNRGVLAAQAGQLEAAFDDFQQTIDLNPNYAKAYSNRAALFVLAGELEQALADYERAAELDPKLAIAHRGCGRTCHMLGRTNEALEHFDAAVELTPIDASSLTSRGDLLTDLGYYSDAAADYDRALEVNGKHAEACRSSAWLLATCPDETVRNPELALRRAELAGRLERNPSALTYDTFAAAQASVGDFGSAVNSIRRAIELSPPSERGAYQDRLHLYQQSTAYTISPVGSVQQAGFER